MWKSLHFKNYIYVSVILDLLVISAIVFLRSFLPPVVPLLYGNPTGNNQLVPTLSLLIAPGISLIVIVANTTLSLFIKNDFAKRILAIATLVIAILTTITIAKIFFLVGYF